MRPGTNQEFTLASFRRGALFPHDLKIIDCILQEDIIPATRVERGYGDIFVLAHDSQRLDFFVFTIHWPLNRGKDTWSDIMSLEWGIILERHRPVTLRPHAVPLFVYHINPLP